MFYQLHECFFYSSKQLKKPDETDSIHVPQMRICYSSNNGSKIYLHFLFFTYVICKENAVENKYNYHLYFHFYYLCCTDEETEVRGG